MLLLDGRMATSYTFEHINHPKAHHLNADNRSALQIARLHALVVPVTSLFAKTHFAKTHFATIPNIGPHLSTPID